MDIQKSEREIEIVRKKYSNLGQGQIITHTFSHVDSNTFVESLQNSISRKIFF